MSNGEIIDLKKQFLSEIASYEKRLFFLFFSGGVGLTIFFYKNPFISWWMFGIVYFIFLVFYEKFMFIGLYERYDQLAREARSGIFTKFDFSRDKIATQHFILYTFKKSTPIQRVELSALLIIGLVFTIMILRPIILALLN